MGTDNREKTIEISDLTGEIAIKEQTRGGQNIMSLSDFSKGIYFVRISDSKTVYTAKLVKQ